jgi:hypothetical protein
VLPAGSGILVVMESRAPGLDPLLAKLAATRGSLTVSSRVAIGGFCFWLLFLAVVAAEMRAKGFDLVYGRPITVLTWLLFAVPILLHIWPILALRRAGRTMAAFAAAPTEEGAVGALRAQGLYWRAAAICHLALILWVIADFIAITVLIASMTKGPA